MYRQVEIGETINLTHMKRIRNQNGVIHMLVGTKQQVSSMLSEEQEWIDVQVPSRMLYQKDLFKKYHELSGWPMTFNT